MRLGRSGMTEEEWSSAVLMKAGELLTLLDIPPGHGDTWAISEFSATSVNIELLHPLRWTPRGQRYVTVDLPIDLSVQVE